MLHLLFEFGDMYGSISLQLVELTQSLNMSSGLFYSDQRNSEFFFFFLETGLKLSQLSLFTECSRGKKAIIQEPRQEDSPWQR